MGVGRGWPAAGRADWLRIRESDSRWPLGRDRVLPNWASNSRIGFEIAKPMEAPTCEPSGREPDEFRLGLNSRIRRASAGRHVHGPAGSTFAVRFATSRPACVRPCLGRCADTLLLRTLYSGFQRAVTNLATIAFRLRRRADPNIKNACPRGADRHLQAHYSVLSTADRAADCLSGLFSIEQIL